MTSFLDVLSIISDVLLWISFAGAIGTILTFTIFGDIRTYPIKLIMFLCACIAAGYSIFFFSYRSFVVETWLCWPVSMLILYFFLANFSWMFCVAFNFYQMIVRRNRESEALEKWYHVGCWGAPLIVVICVAATRKFGRVGDPANLYSLISEAYAYFCSCYIPSGTVRLCAFFIPGLIVISANAILFFFIGREIHETLATAPKTDKRERRKELRVYLSIFISIGLTWVFGYLIYLIPERIPQTIFLVLFSLTTPLQGFLIFAAYCINAKVASKWAGLFGACIPCCKRWEELASSSTSSRF